MTRIGNMFAPKKMTEQMTNDELIKAIENNDPRFNQFGFFDPRPNTWNPDELAANYQPPKDDKKCQ